MVKTFGDGFRRPPIDMPNSSAQTEALDFIAASGGCWSWQVAEEIYGIKSGDAVRKLLNELRSSGLIEVAIPQGSAKRDGKLTKSHFWRVTETGALLAKRV